MNKRLFTFGCSYTKYDWPTWADFIQFNYNEFQNWGVGAADNYFIFHSLIEAHNKNNFTSNDTIVIMWSMHMRFAFLTNKNKWQREGPWSTPKTLKALDSFWSEKGQMIKSLEYMQMAHILLKSLGVNFRMTIMAPLNLIWEQYPDLSFYDLIIKDYEWVNPSLETWRWLTPDFVRERIYPEGHYGAGEPDHHPPPGMHFGWVEAVLGPSLNIEMPVEAFRLLRNWKKVNYQSPDIKRMGWA